MSKDSVLWNQGLITNRLDVGVPLFGQHRKGYQPKTLSKVCGERHQACGKIRSENIVLKLGRAYQIW